MNVGSIPLIYTTQSPSVNHAVQMLPTSMITWRRQDELDADYFGAEYFYLSGYDPSSFAQMIEHVWGQHTKNAFDPLPPTEERMNSLQTEIAKFPVRVADVRVSVVDFQLFQERLRSWKSAP